MSTVAALRENLAARSQMTPEDAGVLLEQVVRSVADVLLTTGSAVLPGLGKLRLKTRKARQGLTPTGKAWSLPERQVITFTPSIHLTRLVG